MQPYESGVKQQAMQILTQPPRSGSFSVYAKKLTALGFVWLCSLVVWGNVANVLGTRGNNGGYPRGRFVLILIFGLFCWALASFLLICNYFAERATISRDGFFKHAVEAQITALLVIIWIPVVGAASHQYGLPYESVTPPATIWFSWLGFFACIYATLKAYHSFKEEDLPSDLPEGYNEEEYVYG